MQDSDSLKDYQRVRQLAIRSLFEIIEQSSEGTIIVDRDARIVWMNQRYARRFGLEDASAAIGQPCESVIPGSQMRDVITQGRPILLDMLDTPKEPLVVMRLPIHDAELDCFLLMLRMISIVFILASIMGYGWHGESGVDNFKLL